MNQQRYKLLCYLKAKEANSSYFIFLNRNGKSADGDRPMYCIEKSDEHRDPNHWIEPKDKCSYFENLTYLTDYLSKYLYDQGAFAACVFSALFEGESKVIYKSYEPSGIKYILDAGSCFGAMFGKKYDLDYDIKKSIPAIDWNKELRVFEDSRIYEFEHVWYQDQLGEYISDMVWKKLSQLKNNTTVETSAKLKQKKIENRIEQFQPKNLVDFEASSIRIGLSSGSNFINEVTEAFQIFSDSQLNLVDNPKVKEKDYLIIGFKYFNSDVNDHFYDNKYYSGEVIYINVLSASDCSKFIGLRYLQNEPINLFGYKSFKTKKAAIAAFKDGIEYLKPFIEG